MDKELKKIRKMIYEQKMIDQNTEIIEKKHTQNFWSGKIQ